MATVRYAVGSEGAIGVRLRFATRCTQDRAMSTQDDAMTTQAQAWTIHQLLGTTQGNVAWAIDDHAMTTQDHARPKLPLRDGEGSRDGRLNAI